MNKTKETLVVGFALFSMFFGAGNLILPPFLGAQAGPNWLLVTFGFVITAVVIPILGILAHARLQGTMFDFGKKVSPIFSTIYCLIVYTISITLPAPRTASVTHEMAIAPILNSENSTYFQAIWNSITDLFHLSNSLLTSFIYFVLVFLFVINRSKIINLIGKFLTPLIIVILLAIICIGVFTSPETVNSSVFKTPIVDGLLEGYQTFDAIGAVVIGGVIIISLKLKGYESFESKKELIKKSGFIAGIGLFVIYAGLILNGSLFSSTFAENASRTQILSGLSTQTLGNIGNTFLSVLVALACFTTAVGIVTGTADYFKGLFKESQLVYTVTAIIGCVLGVAMGQLDVNHIIHIALPVLMFIYPITIVLILLNVLSEKWATENVFRAVVIVTFVFSIPDFLSFILPEGSLDNIKSVIPFANYGFGWVLPALVSFVLVNVALKASN